MTLQNTINNNLVRYMELIPGTNAFIDARTPGSDLKITSASLVLVWLKAAVSMFIFVKPQVLT